MNTVRGYSATAALLAVLFLDLAASPPEPSLEPWEDIRVPSRNGELMHASFVSFDTAAAAVKARFRHSPWVQSLNGDWKFTWVRSRRTVHAISSGTISTSADGWTSRFPPTGR